MTDIPTGPALPGEKCSIAPGESWSDLEKWVWNEIGSGRIADINAHLGRTADPKKPEDWGLDRRLRPTFLETILLHDPWRNAIPRQGVRIEGGVLDQPLDLSDANILSPLWLEKFRFCRPVKLLRIYAPRGFRSTNLRSWLLWKRVPPPSEAIYFSAKSPAWEGSISVTFGLSMRLASRAPK